MKQFRQSIAALVVVLFVSHAQGADKVVVVPLNSAKKLQHVVTVSAKGGDFTDPVAAVNSISDASEANPYLVLIGPGIYTLTQPLAMKPYVTIAGSGREATTLTGALSSGNVATSAMVLGADNATLRDMTVENTGGSSASIVLYNDNDSPAVYTATFRALGGVDGNVGVLNINTSSPTISDATIDASGGTECYGVSNNLGSTTLLTEVMVRASGGTQNYGVGNFGNSTVAILRSIISGIDGTHAAIKVNDAAGTVTVYHSIILGGVSSSGTLSCLQSTGFLSELGPNCI